MKLSRLTAGLIALLAIATITTEASAMYHADMGRFLQRDPHGTMNAPTAPRVGMAGPAAAGGFVARDPMPTRPQPGLQYADGMNLYQYVLNNPNIGLDPFGLDTYRQNRELGGNEAVEHEISHTFIFTTREVNGVEFLEHTYRWGNTYDADDCGVWHKDHANDVAAAMQALRQKDAWEHAPWYAWPFLPDNWGRRIGGESLDPHVETAFQRLATDPNERHRWWPWNNCKHEATALIGYAERLRTGGSYSDCVNRCRRLNSVYGQIDDYHAYLNCKARCR